MDTLPHDLAAMLEEMPRLARVRAFLDALENAPLFDRLGEPLDARDKQLAHAFLDAIGATDAAPALIESWEDADAATAMRDDGFAGTDIEQAPSDAVIEAALARVNPAALGVVTERAMEVATSAARARLEPIAAASGVIDRSLIELAVASVAVAAYSAALALIAADEDEEEGAEGGALAEHPFGLRFGLYARGRWPIGLTGSTYNIF